MYLLGFAPGRSRRTVGLLESGRLHLFGLDASDAPRMRALMRKYRDLPMDLADASVVAVAEREGINKVFARPQAKAFPDRVLHHGLDQETPVLGHVRRPATCPDTICPSTPR